MNNYLDDCAKIHHCEKWDKLIELEGVEINDDGTIQMAYVDFDDSWSYGYDSTLNFVFCPYCGVKI